MIDEGPMKINWWVDFKQASYDIKVTLAGQIIYSQGKQSCDNSATIDGITLEAGAKYDVELLVTGEQGESHTLTNFFRAGNRGQFKGEWLGNGKFLQDENRYYQGARNPVFRKTINLTQEVEEAFIHIVGLGYYNLYINGQRISDAELNSDWTNYDKTTCYDTHELSHYLKKGHNELFVELGNGWYNPAPLTLFSKYNLRDRLSIGEPKLLADLIIKDAKQCFTISSDNSWEVAEGPYLFNNLYLGESLDFRLIKEGSEFDFNQTSWQKASITEGPKGKLIPSYIPKIKQLEAVQVADIYELDKDRIIVDFAEMVAGFIDITLLGRQDQLVELRYSEEINPDYSLNTESTLAGLIGKRVQEDFVIPGGPNAPTAAEQTDNFICRDGRLRFTNKFTFHSFRYVEIRGLKRAQIEDINAIYVHTKLEQSGDFSCSDAHLNQLHQVASRTKKNNLHSVFGDCARERLAYGGDIVALATSQLYMFDSASVYEKTLKDFINDFRENGGVPETAPFMGIQSKGTGDGAGPLGWQLVFPYLLKRHYQYYGDIKLIETLYPYVEKQLAHLNSLGLEKIAQSCLGDWGSINPNADAGDYKNSSPAIDFTATCFYYFHLLLAAQLSEYIGRDDNCQQYRQQAEQIKLHLVQKYRNSDGSFADKSQTSYVFAIYFELADDMTGLVSVLAELISSNNYRLQCGIFGQSFAYEILRKYNHNDLIYKWLHCDAGFKHMLSNNSHALKEFFGENENGSCNHAMFSSYPSWLYQSLGGIEVCDDACGADKMIIKPYFETTINHVECRYQTMKGMVVVNWSRSKSNIKLQIEIPFNLTSCTLILDRMFESSVSHLNVIYVEKMHIAIDITEVQLLNLT